MNNLSIYEYVSRFGVCQKRSMFGGEGLFIQDAMFILINNDRLYLRGGKELDNDLMILGCPRFLHIKKQSTVMVNYYDISDLYHQASPELDSLVYRSIYNSVEYRKYRKSARCKRIRDLPNMRLTIERMLKKSGVSNVTVFMELGAAEVYRKVQSKYGNDIDISLLWKFAGAIDGIHWKLLAEPTKKALKRSCG